jgi:hypothetical protein
VTIGLMAAMMISAAAGCTNMSRSDSSALRAQTNFDLSKCEALEPGLFRCPGYDAPLCNPDFSRNDIECVKVTRDGVLIQARTESQDPREFAQIVR